MAELVSQAMKEKSESEDGELNQLILDAAVDGETETIETYLQLIKIDNTWKIIIDDGSMDAICGGFFSGLKGFD